MLWYPGDHPHNRFHGIVEDYFNKKMLAKLGYTFEGSKITDFEVEAYNVIAVEAAKLEREDLIRESKKNKRG